MQMLSAVLTRTSADARLAICMQEPPAVKLNDELGGLLTYKLAGEDVVRDSGVSYAVVRPCALTEEPAGAELLVDQGDTIKGKISRSVHGCCPAACMLHNDMLLRICLSVTTNALHCIALPYVTT